MTTRRFLLSALTGAVVVCLGGCGGGDDAPPQPAGPTIDIGLANHQTVAQAVIAGLVGMSPTGMMAPLSVGSPGTVGLMSTWLQPLSKRVAIASTSRQYPKTVYGPYTNACAISGTVTEWDDDRDESGGISVGDVVTLQYNQCQDKAGETSNGSMTMTLTQVSVTPVPSGSVHMALTQMSYVTPRHSMTFSGPMQVDYTNPSPSVETGRVTAIGPVTIAVSTHTGFLDTVTLQSGFVVDDTYDSSLGRTVSTASGLLQSVAAGGIVRVSPVAGAPVTKYDNDAYPRAGAVQVSGKNSTLLMTALSATDVQLDVDADGNGSFESGSTMLWDDLL
jgi:hypothetical protein